jgi:hypothetical protein
MHPPLAGYLPSLERAAEHGAAYLGNLWRPDESDAGALRSDSP